MYHYKVVIADDEAFIRMGLEKLLTQTFDNIKITGIYANGRDILSHLAREEVDILITDIRMPQASGLDVARYIHEKRLGTRVLVITGFQDFTYAHQALEYQVEHLLLKPIDFDKLLDCMEQTMHRIEVQAQGVYDETRQMLMLHALKRRDLAMLVSGELSTLSENRKLELISSNGRQYAGWCALVRFTVPALPETVKDIAQFWYDCGEFQSEHLDVYCIAAGSQGASLLLLTDDTEKSEAGNRVKQYSEEVSRHLHAIGGRPADYSVHLYESLEEIYRQNRRNLAERYVECVMHKDTMGRRELVELAAEVCSANQLSDMVVRCVQKLSSLYNWDDNVLLHKLETCVRKDEVAQVLRQLDALVEQRLAEADGGVISRIIDYINTHYAEDITLDSVADTFHFSRSHISRMFKNETGERFVDFLGNVRLLHAKELLKSGKYSVKQIAEMVGYPNAQYFSTVFKEKTGMAPRKYVLETVRQEKEQ